jgi:hypothetical protein
MSKNNPFFKISNSGPLFQIELGISPSFMNSQLSSVLELKKQKINEKGQISPTTMSKARKKILEP